MADRDRRAQALATQIASLTEELNLLLVADAPPAPPTSSSEPFVKGTRVQILNRYRGLQGQTGVVTRPTRVFIFFRLDSSGAITSRQRKNLRILPSRS